MGRLLLAWSNHLDTNCQYHDNGDDVDDGDDDFKPALIFGKDLKYKYIKECALGLYTFKQLKHDGIWRGDTIM